MSGFAEALLATFGVIEMAEVVNGFETVASGSTEARVAIPSGFTDSSVLPVVSPVLQENDANLDLFRATIDTGSSELVLTRDTTGAEVIIPWAMIHVPGAVVEEVLGTITAVTQGTVALNSSIPVDRVVLQVSGRANHSGVTVGHRPTVIGRSLVSGEITEVVVGRILSNNTLTFAVHAMTLPE